MDCDRHHLYDPDVPNSGLGRVDVGVVWRAMCASAVRRRKRQIVTRKSEDIHGGLSASSGGLRRRSVLLGGAAAAVTASAASTTGTPAAAAGPAASRTDGRSPSRRRGDQLSVGAGKAEISIPAATYQAEGYNDIHDPLYARLLLAKTNSASLVLLVLDLTSISEEAIADIRTSVATVTGVAPESIMVTVTHNFSSPHVGPASSSTQAATWVANLVAAATSAAKAAVAGLTKARVGYGAGNSNVNVNRNLLTKDGYYLGANEQLPSDKTVLVARFDDATGQPIAILINYSVQSSVIMESSTSGNSTYPLRGVGRPGGRSLRVGRGRLPGRRRTVHLWRDRRPAPDLPVVEHADRQGSRHLHGGRGRRRLDAAQGPG
ncbi:hypothetical protein [Nocardioides sp. KR10-350]|uniref:hypothetical protein n=1 Tax=Nocardioides cheoyonin TaxID=3156615 RepID=UPI0032B3AD63